MVSQAMGAYHRGTDNFNAGKFEAALSDFKEAASLYASADFQYNIARCYEELEKHEEAVRAFQTYLKAKPDADDRASVENRIKLLEKLIEEKRKRREQEANQEPTVIVQQVGEDKSAKRKKAARPLIISGAVIAGLGAATAIGGGLGFGLAANSRSNDLDAVQTGGNPDNLTFAEATTVADEGKRLETFQIVTAAGGGGLAVVGIVLLSIGVVFNKTPSTKAAGSGKDTAHNRRARRPLLVPSLGQGRAGLSLVGRF